jgi:hypothetical protein
MAKKKFTTAESTGAAEGEHALTTKLRDLVEHPENHTVGALAAAVDQALSELMMFRDRLDLLDDHGTKTTKGPKAPTPVSAPAEASVGLSTARRAS